MTSRTTTLPETDGLVLGNEHRGKLSFQSRYVLPVGVDEKRITGLMRETGNTGPSFFEFQAMSERDEGGYQGKLTGAMRARLKDLLATDRGNPIVFSVRQSHLEPLRCVAFNPANLDQAHIIQISAIELVPFTHGNAYLVVTVQSPTSGPLARRHEPVPRWPLRTIVDLNYYLSRLNVSKKSVRNYSISSVGDGSEKRQTFMHRLMSVCADEVVRGGRSWDEIWKNAGKCSELVKQEKRAVVYSHACVVPSCSPRDQTFSLDGNEGVEAVGPVFFDLRPYRPPGRTNPPSHTEWPFGRAGACRVHGYTPKHIMGVLLNGRELHDSTQYPRTYHGSNFFSFLLAFSMRSIYDDIQRGVEVPTPWVKLADVFRPDEVTESSVRAEFLKHCMRFFVLEPCFMDTQGAKKLFANGDVERADFNYQLRVDVDQSTVILKRRMPSKKDVYKQVYQTCANGEAQLLIALALYRDYDNKHLSHETVLKIRHFDDQDELDKVLNLDRKSMVKKANIIVNSLRRTLKKADVDPNHIFAMQRGKGIFLQPAVEVINPKLRALSGAIRDDAYGESGQQSLLNGRLDADLDADWPAED